jgi:hypothetical protein
VGRGGHLPGHRGKINEEWAADDVAAIMAQIGAFNPPWAA